MMEGSRKGRMRTCSRARAGLPLGLRRGQGARPLLQLPRWAFHPHRSVWWVALAQRVVMGEGEAWVVALMLQAMLVES